VVSHEHDVLSLFEVLANVDAGVKGVSNLVHLVDAVAAAEPGRVLVDLQDLGVLHAGEGGCVGRVQVEDCLDMASNINRKLHYSSSLTLTVHASASGLTVLTPLCMKSAEVSGPPPRDPSSTISPSSLSPKRQEAVISDQ
jgi:hypothetical protein